MLSLLRPLPRSSIPLVARRPLILPLSPSHTPSPFRCKSTDAPVSRPTTTPRASGRTPTGHAQSNIKRALPERIVIYSGGTGRTMFLGALRVTTMFLFGVSCLVVAPAFMSEDSPWYQAPIAVVGGALPWLFISYTSAPFVHHIHLALPVFARKSKDAAVQYVKNLPPTATLYINTMKMSSLPRQSQIRLGDLAPDRARLRPVTFQNLNPEPLPWWAGKTIRQFYVEAKSKPGPREAASYPVLWEHVYGRIMNNSPRKRV